MFKRWRINKLKRRGEDLRFVREQEEQRKLLATANIRQIDRDLSAIQLELIRLEFPIKNDRRRPMATFNRPVPTKTAFWQWVENLAKRVAVRAADARAAS